MWKNKNRRELNLAEEMIIFCANGGVKNDEAQKAIRALCRYFGGQMIYVPSKKDDGKTANTIRGLLTDAAGENTADRVLERMMTLYGGGQVYVPLERSAFRKIIALEIFERYNKGGVSMNDLAREYHITFTHAYRLWREGRHEKHAKSLPFLPFLEFSQ